MFHGPVGCLSSASQRGRSNTKPKDHDTSKLYKPPVVIAYFVEDPHE